MAVDRRTLHDVQAEEARRSRDPALIRKLYDDYGLQLLDEFAGRESEVTQHGSGKVAQWQAANLSTIASSGFVLDVGCGPRPEVSMRLARPGRPVVCSDISFGLVALARAATANENLPDVHFVVADAEALPFETGTFALVLADDVIEHVPHPELLAAEAGRVVAEGGVVSVSTPNRRAVSVFVDRVRDLLRGSWGPPERYFLVTSHLREYTRGELRAMFRKLFRRTRFVPIGWDGDEAVKRLASAVTTTPGFGGLARHWIVLARKPRRS
jgi:2-polyprenyl-3-methyl-5-hydroxy-6-metoxy-1,4-benzoquinol methylase